jgi:hypothetical protein
VRYYLSINLQACYFKLLCIADVASVRVLQFRNACSVLQVCRSADLTRTPLIQRLNTSRSAQSWKQSQDALILSRVR